MHPSQPSTSDQVLILGDLHFGLRGASPIFATEVERFLEDVLYPSIDEVRPKAIIFEGDILDNRTLQHVRTIDQITRFNRVISSFDIPTFYILGNHDVPYRDTLDFNPVEPLCMGHRNIHVINKPMELKVVDRKFLMVPWICDANRDLVKEHLRETDASAVVGHFHLPGFDLGGKMSEGGQDIDLLLARFERVYSGHFHTRSRRGKILYTGTPYQMTRTDDGLEKGFYYLDTKTLVETWVPNPRQLFVTVTVGPDHEFNSDPVAMFDGKIVTIVAKPDADKSELDSMVRLVEQFAHDHKVVDPSAALGYMDPEEFEQLQATDTWSVIEKAIDEDKDLESLDRGLVKQIFGEVWKEATTGEPANQEFSF